MKKKFMAHLQEFEAKTTNKMRQEKYVKKFIKTAYEKDKENVHPNVRQSHSIKRGGKERK